jgi:iron-sulfur cluster assembly accessory protein
MITISESAVEQLRANKEHEVQNFRMSVMPGGCSGFRYSLMLEDAVDDEDEIVDVAEDIKIIIDPFSAQYLEGTQLDYVKTLTEAGFTFKNPNATAGCGCGSSFAA